MPSPDNPYRIPVGKPLPRPDPDTCDHQWEADEDALTGETYLYCANRCGAHPPATEGDDEQWDFRHATKVELRRAITSEPGSWLKLYA